MNAIYIHRGNRRHAAYSVAVLVTLSLLGCTPQPSTGGGGTGTGGTGGDGTNGGADSGSGTFDPTAGLRLEADGFTLDVPPAANPSNATITMRRITSDERIASGLPDGFGFDDAVSFEPSGTTFGAPVEITVALTTPTTLDTLDVLRFDESAGVWTGTDITATVSADGAAATFHLTGFSSYDPWNPPLPPGSLPIGEGEIVAGTGLFEGQPFNVFPNYTNTSASLTYSAFGDVFALALINVDLENPMTGDHITLSAGLHATEVRDMEGGAKLGLVTPAGGLSGPSLYADATGFPKPVAGVMFLRKTATHWIVDVYCHYEGGIVFGQATGEL
ncbi:MAG: hypothetical protein Q7R41_00450 [Phycisphaerales bacterium]|nr:hypothetical protein [Phycisphaerales bacterium]